MKIENPILKGFNPDPSICRNGEDYYIANSTFEWFPGVQIHHSKDLKNWDLVAHPLNRLSLLDMKGNPNSGGIWAPCLSYQDDKFWLVYTDVKVVDGPYKDGHNYLTTCDTVDGEWSEPIYLNASGFDASLFHDEISGKKYLLNMFWDAREYKHSFYGIVMQEYSMIEKKLVGKQEVIYKGTKIGLVEGPHLYWKDGFYYLFAAQGGTTYNHQEVVARSKNIFGPYETQPGETFLSAWDKPEQKLQKCGHGQLIETPDDESYFVHLTGRPIPSKMDGILDDRGYCPLGRETAIQEVVWNEGWPYIVGGKQGRDVIEAPKNVREVVWNQNYNVKDDFDSEKLNINFQSLRVPLSPDIMSLNKRKGFLRLFGRESLFSLFTQSLVARRWQSLNFDAETKVDFKPLSFNQTAGLVCYYDTLNWTNLQVTWNEKKGRVIEVVSSDNGIYTSHLKEQAIKIPENTEFIYLKVQVRYDEYTYSYSFDGENWNKLEIIFDSRKLSDDYVIGGGFFTGAFVGINCIDQMGTRIAADFDYFVYKELLE